MALRGRFPRARGRGGCAGVRRSSRTHAAYLKIAFSGRALASEVSPFTEIGTHECSGPLWQMAGRHHLPKVCTAHAAPVGRPHGSSCTRRGPRNSPERRRPRATAAGGPLGVLAQAGPILGVAARLQREPARASLTRTHARALAALCGKRSGIIGNQARRSGGVSSGGKAQLRAGAGWVGAWRRCACAGSARCGDGASTTSFFR